MVTDCSPLSWKWNVVYNYTNVVYNYTNVVS